MEKDKQETDTFSHGTSTCVELIPYKIDDPKYISKLWERIEIEDSGSLGISPGKDIAFRGSELFRISLHSLNNEMFKDYISVSAMGFPILHCFDEVEKHKRRYNEWIMSDEEGKDLIPLSDVRGGDYKDPWTDGRFPQDASEYFGGKILPETCIWIKCPECHGEGGHTGKVSAGYGDRGYITCPDCNGSGMTGAVLCERCHGKGGYYSYARVEKSRTAFIECKKCRGKGKVRSVLRAFESKKTTARSETVFTAIPDGTIPKELLDDNRNCPSAYEYKVISKISATGARVTLSDERLPNCGDATPKLKKKLLDLQKECAEDGVRYLSETICIERCVRYVRFRFRFFVPSYIDLSKLDGIKDKGVGFREEVKRLASKGILPKGYFSCRHEFSDTIIWLDTATGRTYGEFPEKGDIMDWHNDALAYLLLAMGKHADTGEITKKKDKRHSTGREKGKVSTSSKKRWKFVVLGILLGFFGVHLAYAKRWLLFLLLWAGFIAGNVMSGGSSKPEQDTANAPQVTQTENQEKRGGSPIGGIGFAVWALLWIGGTLFIKKDGKGNRM